MTSGGGGTNLFSCFSSHSIQNLQSIQSLKPGPGTVPKSNLNSPTGVSNTANSANDPTDDVFDDKIGSVSPQQPSQASQCLTLLDWIKSTDPNNKLHALIDETSEILGKLETGFKWNELNSRVEKLFEQIENNPQMREIEGLTKRLDDLKDFLIQANKFLANQNEITEVIRFKAN